MAASDDRDISRNPNRSDKPKYQARYENSYAIVIGIDTYKDPKLRPLGKAEEDSLGMKEVLSGDPYNFQVELLIGQKATRRSITQALNDIIRKSREDDRVVFYFAGHGYIVQNNRGFDIGYLACADTNPDDLFDGLEYDEVIKLTQFAKAKHIAFILDACFSGSALGITRASMQPVAVQEYLLHRAYQVITAGGVEVVSDARSMTGELIKLLREDIPGKETPLTFSHLGQYVHDLIHNQSKGRQSPIFGFLEGSSKGQMILKVPPIVKKNFSPTFTDRLVEELIQRFNIDELRILFFDNGFPEYYVNWKASLYDVCLDIIRVAIEKDFMGDFLKAAVKERPNIPSVLGQLLDEMSNQEISKKEPVLIQQQTISPEADKFEQEAREKNIANSTPPVSILDILPPPFEWCDIPAGRVTLEEVAGTFDVKPFKMAKYPITYAQYQVFMDAKDGFSANRWWSELDEIGTHSLEQNWKIANHPRENISWYAAVAFCRWISYRVGFEIRLATEWEWQWAAQGSDGREYPWGGEYIQGYANVDEESSKNKDGVYLGKTTPVDHYPQAASIFGVFDMSGNVWEWCLNKFHKPASNSISRNAPCVVRGGSWYTNPLSARCASRYGYFPSFSANYLGFRVVLPLANLES